MSNTHTHTHPWVKPRPVGEHLGCSLAPWGGVRGSGPARKVTPGAGIWVGEQLGGGPPAGWEWGARASAGWGGAGTGPEGRGLHFGFTVAIFRVHGEDRILCWVRPGREEAPAGQGGRRDQLQVQIPAPRRVTLGRSQLETGEPGGALGRGSPFGWPVPRSGRCGHCWVGQEPLLPWAGPGEA